MQIKTKSQIIFNNSCPIQETDWQIYEYTNNFKYEQSSNSLAKWKSLCLLSFETQTMQKHQYIFLTYEFWILITAIKSYFLAFKKHYTYVKAQQKVYVYIKSNLKGCEQLLSQTVCMSEHNTMEIYEKIYHKCRLTLNQYEVPMEISINSGNCLGRYDTLPCFHKIQNFYRSWWTFLTWTEYLRTHFLWKQPM